MMTLASPPPLALVTGAGHRLGRQLALILAQLGFTIGVHYHSSKKPAEQTSAEIHRLGGHAHLFNADLTQPDQIENLFKHIQQLPNPLMVLINSASVMPRTNLLEMPSSEWDHVFNLNLRNPWLCAKFASAIMPPGSSIINMTDAAAGRTWTSYAAYSISKSALETLTRLLARSLAPNIRVNGIAPGLFIPSADISEDEWQRLTHKLPLKTPPNPTYLAKAVAYLLENTYITGQILVVDGGYQLT